MHTGTPVKVWDLFVRIFHWTLVVAFFTAYFTEGDPEWLHVWAGYLIVTLVLLRIIWGFVGTPYARFAEFVRPPAQALRYLRDLVRGRAPRYLGHNPAGAIMIVVLLTSLLLTTGAGMVLLAAHEGEGPLAGWLIPVPAVEQGAEAHGEHGEHAESTLAEAAEEVHEFLANFTMLLVIVHIVGVVVGSFKDRENLARSMITGYKRRD